MNTEIVPDTFPSLFWGYLAIWAILSVYLISLGLRVKKLEQSRK